MTFRWKEFFLHRFQLMRLANVFTAIADVLAGYLIVAGADMRFSVLLSLIFSSAAIYAGGCVLNDICDLQVDLILYFLRHYLTSSVPYLAR